VFSRRFARSNTGATDPTLAALAWVPSLSVCF